MARETNTRELVREIAQAALIRGEKPTQAMVRRQILEQHGRTASPNVVTEELNSFLIDSASVNAKRFSLPGLPAAVSESVTALWTIACDHAIDLVADKVQHAEQREIAAEQAVRAIESQLAIEKTHSLSLTHDLDLLNQAINQKILTITELQSELHETRAKLDAAIERNSDLVADKIRGEASAAQRITEIETNSRLELERVRTEHEKAIEQLNTAHLQEAQTWDGLRKHLLNQTDQIRQAAKTADESQRARIADLDVRTGLLTRKANDAQDEASKLRGALEALQTQLVKVESGEKAAREALLRSELFGKGKIAEIGKWLAVASPELQQAFLNEFEK